MTGNTSKSRRVAGYWLHVLDLQLLYAWTKPSSITIQHANAIGANLWPQLPDETKKQYKEKAVWHNKTRTATYAPCIIRPWEYIQDIAHIETTMRVEREALRNRLQQLQMTENL